MNQEDGPKSPKDVLKLADAQKIEFVDFKFIDMLGTWHHLTIPRQRLDEDIFENGLGFDGSSIRGWRAINESDMLFMPDPETAFIDPFTMHPTMSLTCSILDPITKERYNRDPRGVAINCENYAKSLGIADTIYVGPELEFFVFDGIRFESKPQGSFYEILSDEGAWNTGRPHEDGNPNLGNRPGFKGGYIPVAPTDTLTDLRSEMALNLMKTGITVEAAHHEVASGGQCELAIRFNTLLKIADQAIKYKYVIKNTANQWGKTATFMPKPMFGDNGSGMHVHCSLWNGGKNLFSGTGYAGLSDTALYFIGGVLKHAAAVLAFTSPTTNSYRRLVPGYEAPVNLAYSMRNRSAAIRIPMYHGNEAAKRVEFRPPDPSANPYLAFSAIVMAGLDGIQNKIHPGNSLDKNIYDLPPEEARSVPQVPASLEAALDALVADQDFLLKGDVFSKELIDSYISYKRENEVAPLKLRPHPHEFQMYFEV